MVRMSRLTTSQSSWYVRYHVDTTTAVTKIRVGADDTNVLATGTSASPSPSAVAIAAGCV
jgi:hypothetical protein